MPPETPNHNSEIRISGKEIQLSDLVEMMNDSFVVVDEEEVITYVNRAFIELIGYPMQELMGRSLRLFMDDENWDILKRQEASRRKGLAAQYELTWKHWTGESVETMVSASPIMDNQGNYYGSYAVITDLSGFRKSQEALRQSEKRFRYLVEAMNEALVSGNDEFIIEYINDRFVELLGYSRDEVIGHHVIEFVHPDDHEKVRKLIAEKESRDIMSFEVSWSTKDGRRIWTYVAPRSIYNDDRNLVGMFGVLTDITDLKELAEERKKSEKKYRMLAENSIQGLTIIQNQSYVYVNPAFARIVGYTPEEIMSMPSEEAWNLIYEDDKDYLLELAHKRRDGQEIPNPYTYRLVTKSGNIRWVEAFSSEIDYEGQHALQVLVIDITKRKETEQKLRESQQMLRLVMDSIPQQIFWKDRDSVYLGCNVNFAEAAGVGKPDNIAGKTDYDLAWKTEEADFFREADQRVMNTNTPEFRVVQQQTQASGQKAIFETNIIPLHDDQGNVIGVLGTSQDVTEKWEKERKIRESEQKYRALAEQSMQGLTILGNDSLVYANEAFSEMVGIPREKLVDMPIETAWQLFHPEDQELLRQRIDDKRAGRPVPSRYEYRLIHSDGSTKWVEAFANLIEYEGRPAIQTVFIDVSDRKQAERDMKSAEDRASLYLDLMSHDIRNQMQVIMSSAALLKNSADEKLTDSFFQVIAESVQRCSRMIEEVRATEELIGAPLVPRDLNEPILGCVSAILEKARGTEFNLEVGQSEATVLADDYLELMLSNIILNAVEHNPRDDKKVWVRLDKEGDYFVISISDNGPGISDSAKLGLFDKSRRFGGLGLHQANQIAEKYGGFIDVVDRVHKDHTKGAKFKIWLPKESLQELHKD